MYLKTIPTKLVVVGALICGAAYALVGVTPRSLVLSAECTPTTLLNEWRARIQGERFWQSQLAAVDDAIEAPTEMRRTRIRVAQELAPIQQELKLRSDSVLLGVPEHIRQQSVPDSLRELADRTEFETSVQNVERFLGEYAIRMAVCRPKVATKAGIRFN